MKHILSSVALAVMAMSAHADSVPVLLTINGFEHGTALSGTMTIDPVGLSNTDSISATGAVSALDITVNDGIFTQNFLAYCIELLAPTANFGVPAEYTMNSNPFLGAFSIPYSVRQQDRLTKLFVKNALTAGGTFSGGTADKTASAAMQLSIWEIIYDDANFGDLSAGAFGVNAGEFYSTSVSGARAVAENLMFGLDTYNIGNYTVSFTSFNAGGAKSGQQDFLSASLNAGDSCTIGNDCEVPEPNSLAIGATGLMGLVFLRRRLAKSA